MPGQSPKLAKQALSVLIPTAIECRSGAFSSFDTILSKKGLIGIEIHYFRKSG